MLERIDIKENSLLKLGSELLDSLLKDHTTGRNIIWGTDNYELLRIVYRYNEQNFPELITGNCGETIRPRVSKSQEEQQARVKDKAEVFTPSWICNAQNNLVDEAWFEQKNIFNKEKDKNWITNSKPVVFPENKTWQDYIALNRLEVSCGEAPYLVSRYDAISGKPIPIKRRIGLLDRKLRIVGENTTTESEWIDAALTAFKSVYGFEWQGDNLLLARENLLFTYSDYYREKFNKFPTIVELLKISEIISWNLWQMDGLKCVVPYSCHEEITIQKDLLETRALKVPCKGCQKNDIKLHNGKYCFIMDWQTGKRKKFVSLIRREKNAIAKK